MIFSTLKLSDVKFSDVKFDDITYLSNNMIHIIKEPESYYLGSKYVIIEVLNNNKWFEKVKKEIITYSLIAFIFMFIIGYFISKRFLKPNVRAYDDDNRYERHKKRRKQRVLVGYENYFVYKNKEFHKFSKYRKK